MFPKPAQHLGTLPLYPGFPTLQLLACRPLLCVRCSPVLGTCAHRANVAYCSAQLFQVDCHASALSAEHIPVCLVLLLCVAPLLYGPWPC